MRDVAYPYPKATVQNCSEHELHYWVTEASDLGLPVGSFPPQIATDLGNGQPFIYGYADMNEGDVAGVHYYQCNGVLGLLVIND
jgi:hypothetical protein